MSRASVLARGRAAFAAGLTDTCTIRRETGKSNDGHGVVTPTWATVYSGPCRVQHGPAASRPQSPGESYVLMSRRDLQLPVETTAGVRAEDQVTIDICVNDPELVGQVFVVRDEAGKSEATSRRIGIERVTS